MLYRNFSTKTFQRYRIFALLGMSILGQVVPRCVEELRRHPAYVRHQLTVPVAKLSALAEQGEEAFREPLVITRDRIVIDGYARLDLARLQGRVALPCIEYELTEEEALHRILQRLRRSDGLNAFGRILLALDLDLEPLLTEKAHPNQRAGGQNEGSSKLAEAEKMDVRKEIARIAGVSVGNVTKVKQLTTTAHSDILKALRQSFPSIEPWLWSKLSPGEQLEKLWLNQSNRSIAQTIRHLLSPYLPKNLPTALNVGDLIELVAALQSGTLGSVRLASINVPGKAIFVTEEFFRTLEAQGELALTCTTNNP